MNKIEETVTDIKRKLPLVKGVFAAILYGSVSRGDYSLRHSDIDLLIIMDDMNEKKKTEGVIENISLHHRVKIHTEFQGKIIKEEDLTLLWKMAEEGIILFSKGIWFMDSKSIGFSSFRLYRYDTSTLDKVSKVMMSRALHGREGYKGIIDGISLIESGRGSLLVRKNKFKEVEQFFDRFKVKYKIAKTLYG